LFESEKDVFFFRFFRSPPLLFFARLP
jgi:hypothetical protein